MSDIKEMEEDENYTVLSIQNISSVSEQTAASLEEVTASTQNQLSRIEELAEYAKELNDVSKILTNTISSFKIE
jgi:methyl-accepting chemotaxis protein